MTWTITGHCSCHRLTTPTGFCNVERSSDAGFFRLRFPGIKSCGCCSWSGPGPVWPRRPAAAADLRSMRPASPDSSRDELTASWAACDGRRRHATRPPPLRAPVVGMRTRRPGCGPVRRPHRCRTHPPRLRETVWTRQRRRGRLDVACRDDWCADASSDERSVYSWMWITGKTRCRRNERNTTGPPCSRGTISQTGGGMTSSPSLRGWSRLQARRGLLQTPTDDRRRQTTTDDDYRRQTTDTSDRY